MSITRDEVIEIIDDILMVVIYIRDKLLNLKRKLEQNESDVAGRKSDKDI